MSLRINVTKSLGDSSWSEVYYHPDDFGAPTVPLQDRANDLLQQVLRLTARQVLGRTVRIANMDNLREVQLFRYVNRPGTFGFDTDLDQSDMPWTAALMRFNLTNGGQRRIFFRGIADAVTKYTDGLPLPLWMDSFTRFTAFLVAGGYSGFSILPSLNTFQAITSINVVAGLVRITVPANGVLDQEKIRITKLVSNPVLNKVWKVNKITDNVLELQGSVITVPSVIWQPGGGIKTQRDDQGTITSGSVIKFTKRNPGGPFGRARGRRRKPRPLLPSVLTG